MALIGGSLTGPLVFVLPPLMYARAVALKNGGNRSNTPEVYSTTERRQSTGDVILNSRIHSRSVYDGFLGKPVSHRYSYIYYYDLENELEERSDEEEIEENYYNLNVPNEFSMTRRNQQDEDLLIDASQPSLRSRRRRVPLVQPPSKSHILCDLKRTMNWFGYLIVIIGIAITVSSTYINIRNTIRYVRFTPPCIVNASVVQSSV